MLYLLRFMYRNLKGYRLFVLIAILVSFGEVAAAIGAAYPLKWIPNKLQPNAQNPAGQDPEPIFNGLINFFDKFGTPAKATLTNPHPHTVVGVILFSCAVLVFFALMDAILSYLDLYLAAYIGQNLTARLRNKLFEQIQRLSLDWHGKQKKGDLVQRVTGNITDIEKFVTDGLVTLLAGILTILGVAVVMFLNSVPYALLSVVIVPALAVVVFSYTSTIKAAAKKTSKANAEVADVAVEDVGAITVIKAFDLVERETDRFNQYVDKTRKAGLRAGGLQAQFTPLVTVLIGIGTAVIIGIGAYVAAGNTFSFIVTVPGGSIGVGTVILFIYLLDKLFQPMKDLSKLMNIATSAAAGAERIQDILNQTPEVIETSTPYAGPQTLRGEIVFENVTFGYTPEKLILKGINLHIPAGRKVALVGLSGGGKTTLVKLIPRFYEVSGGVVKIDERDTRQYPLSLLRQNVGMVLQETVLFEGTILENLKIARPNAAMDEVIKAAQQAHIHDTIMSWPEGYGTLVRNQGKNFSGGQRQRLAIARTLLSNAHILVLDEPTAALDVEAELEVMTALEELVVGRTVLMISHRLSTLGKVDEIIVLKDGLIVEQGTYKDLKSRPHGIFADLLGKQKQYDADYVGGSIIVPQAEIARLIQAKQGAVPPDQLVPLQPSSNGQNRRRKARVMVEVDGRITGEFELDKPVLRIGRLSSNDIQVPSDRVSRFHAKIREERGAWAIEDAQSLNGLIYQGERTDNHTLRNGDRIYLGPRVVLVYQEESVPVASRLAAPHPTVPTTPAPVPPAPRSIPPTPVLPTPYPGAPKGPAAASASLAPRAQIVIEVDGRTLGAYQLGKDVVTIGRLPNNDIPISSQFVSGQHATIMKQNGNWLIVDKGSRNGLSYQGRTIPQHTLTHGDRIFLGKGVALRYEVLA